MQSKFNIKSIYEIVKFNAIGALYRIIKLNFFVQLPSVSDPQITFATCLHIRYNSIKVTSYREVRCTKYACLNRKISP